MFGFKKIEEARYEAEQMFLEGFAKNYPILLAHVAVKQMMRERGLPVPEDVLAFASEGRTSDHEVVDWYEP